MKPCFKCSVLRAKWVEAGVQTAKAVQEHAHFSTEIGLAMRSEEKARKKWLTHSVGCKAASEELFSLLSLDRQRRILRQQIVRPLAKLL
jgi:hypothetical protein